MRVCLFGASSEELAPLYYRESERLGRLLARRGHTLVFGGSAGGLMGACARGLLAEGGRAVGVAPRFFGEQGVPFGEGCEMIFTDTMAERKSRMEALAEGYVALPGGVGTLDELFEVLTLRQLGRHDRPIVLLNTAGFYDGLLRVLRDMADGGFVGRSCLEQLAVCAEPERALEALEEGPRAPDAPRRIADYWR
ncbi:MAG: TIGR00730 family Rossman fold protein [Oscillospiraceae bacterium]|nr:TIGR00730 family Rossman fold protein [Oscillospiraceae bacterium]